LREEEEALGDHQVCEPPPPPLNLEDLIQRRIASGLQSLKTSLPTFDWSYICPRNWV